MMELIQFPWSPFCIVQRRILEYSGRNFKLVDIPSTDRSLVWHLTRERYYAVPVLKDGSEVIFETGEETQVIAKYLDVKWKLGLFPREWEGVQDLLWRYFESEVESSAFRLNDIYFEEFVPKKERLAFIRHKERKFGRGCMARWREEQKQLLHQLEAQLSPCEQMVSTRPFLLCDRPVFVDFDLFGMIENFLYSGHYSLPSTLPKLKAWRDRMAQVEHAQASREKLHS